jgi:hypothetical protein
MSNNTEQTNKFSKRNWFNKKTATISIVAGALLLTVGGGLLYFGNQPSKNAQAATPFDSITSANIVANPVVGSALGVVTINNLPGTVTSCNIVIGSTIATFTGATLTGAGPKSCASPAITTVVSSLDAIDITLGVSGSLQRTFAISPKLPSSVGTQNQTTDTNFQFNKSSISFLKSDRTTNAQNGILHKDWRTGVSTGTNNGDLIVKVTGFRAAQNLLDASSYTCVISVRPTTPTDTGTYIPLVFDTSGDNAIGAGETATAIPYTVANGCATTFTNANRVGGGGQTAIISTAAKNYQWDVKVDVKDSGGNIVDTETTFYEFKFAAIIPGG